MLHFFNKKPYLKDLIPHGHLDFHSHLLPGIDDGAKTIDDTRHLIAALREMGVERFIVTPHIMKNVWENSEQKILDNLAQTQQSLLRNGIDIPIRAAAEYLMDGSFVQHFREHPLLTVKDNYVLVEMSYLNPPIQLYNILFDLQVAGYKPILAHPERYLFYHANFSEYEKLKNAGCVFQINLLSTVGYYGPEVADVAKKLLSRGMIDFAGSDVHHKNHVAGFSKRVTLSDPKPLAEALEHNKLFWW
ncbi:tyrosine-protein phosphatase [Flavobacterium caeni]|uniref:protein-tyrosine-phosphatase n=1 Tax=Flavobacterium caeni TaxID=490189 RepID=A0A1G5FJQ8_9FLAO|nr:CpsB/CapC family capsule biosynthesis tyrosine phosphatase [Flavobacterium caeni]SCY39532.1 Tyrosine-protein phosphatase YwqE [Flavobacterium caeni]